MPLTWSTSPFPRCAMSYTLIIFCFCLSQSFLHCMEMLSVFILHCIVTLYDHKVWFYFIFYHVIWMLKNFVYCSCNNLLIMISITWQVGVVDLVAIYLSITTWVHNYLFYFSTKLLLISSFVKIQMITTHSIYLSPMNCLHKFDNDIGCFLSSFEIVAQY